MLDKVEEAPPPAAGTGALANNPPGGLYAATARAPLAIPQLDRDTEAEVLVVGGGYTGLSTALHLAERGRSVVLLEAHEPGYGAAGRNGGQVNPGLKYEPDAAERLLGPDFGPRFTSLALEAPELLFALIARHRIECEAQRCGTLRVAPNYRHVALLRESVEQGRRRGIPIELWSKAQVDEATGTARYVAGTFDPRGGALNPLSLARGLAEAAMRAGARLFGQSRLLSLERDGIGWRGRTNRAMVRAEQVVIATDGYTDDLWPGLRTSLVPIFSAIIATAPLPAALARQIVPGGQVVYESGRITSYYRRDAAGRLLVGGRGPQHPADRRTEYRHLVRHALALWPALKSVEWTHWWNGQFAVTRDFMPRFHQPAPGVSVLFGYSGRGVALSVALGEKLAAVLSGAAPGSFPLPVSPIEPMWGHRFWRLGVWARIWHGRVLDRLGR